MFQALTNMQIVLLGTGKLANALGMALHQHGLQISGIWGRNSTKAKALAEKLDAKIFDHPSELPRNADVYLVAVSDDAVRQVAATLGKVEGIVAHLSGSLPCELLGASHQRHGLMYPLQTFSHERISDFSNIPILVQAHSLRDLEKLTQLASKLSSRVIKSTDAMRRRLHLAAVFACNFVNALYCMSNEILKSDGLDFDLLQPLILETAQKVTIMPPEDAQTGPARRGDENTIDRHLKQLKDYTTEKLVYELLTNYITKKYQPPQQ